MLKDVLHWTLRNRRKGWFGAFLALGLLLAPTAEACRANPLSDEKVVQNSVVRKGGATGWYSALTDRYGHGVLGDALEPTTLHLLTDETSAQCGLQVTLEAPLVFEDVAPRLIDLTGNGVPELIVVRSHADKGAQLAIYGQVGTELELITATPYIGTRNRWLAPVGAADLDGDGYIEIAYIDRPHLAKTLRIWRFKDQALTPVIDMPGLTNHRIGENFISGGIRTCGGRSEIVVADASWTRIVGIQLNLRVATPRDLGPFSAQALRQELTCP